MSKNNYWVLILKEERSKLFTSWTECEKEMSGASRVICRGFPTEDEAREFMDGKWRRKLISKAAGTWLGEYKTKPGQLKPDTELDISKLSSGEYPKYCAYVDGSYDPRSKIYGFGVVFIHDGKIDKFYGSRKRRGFGKYGMWCR